MKRFDSEIEPNIQAELINVKQLFKVMNEACLGSINEIIEVGKEGISKI